MIHLASYLLIGTLLFIAGVVVMLARKNIVAILLGVELIMNGAGLTFVAYSHFGGNLDGQIFSLFIIIVAAAEAAVGLALVIRFFQMRESIHIDDASQLQG